VDFPLNTFQDYIAKPLAEVPGNPAGSALQQWQSASSSQQKTWANAYGTALRQAPDTFSGNTYAVPAGGYGPLAAIMTTQYQLAISGGLDNALRQNTDTQVWFNDDYTLAELYMGDSGKAAWATWSSSAARPTRAAWYPARRPPRARAAGITTKR